MNLSGKDFLMNNILQGFILNFIRNFKFHKKFKRLRKLDINLIAILSDKSFFFILKNIIKQKLNKRRM